MEGLIHRAFLHVDVLGPHVQEGHFDLVGPNGDIILPSEWESVVEPGWNITMHMWPMVETPIRGQVPPPPYSGARMVPPGVDPQGATASAIAVDAEPPRVKRKAGGSRALRWMVGTLSKSGK